MSYEDTFVRNELGISGDLLKPLHHRKHEEGREEAKNNKYCPYHPQWKTTPKESTYTDKEIAKSSGNKPSTHHHSLILGRSNLGNKGDTHRRQEQLGKCQHKIC